MGQFHVQGLRWCLVHKNRTKRRNLSSLFPTCVYSKQTKRKEKPFIKGFQVTLNPKSLSISLVLCVG